MTAAQGRYDKMALKLETHTIYLIQSSRKCQIDHTTLNKAT